MTYKDKLLKEIEDAKKEIEIENAKKETAIEDAIKRIEYYKSKHPRESLIDLQKKLTEEDNANFRRLLISMIDTDTIEQCSYLDEFKVYGLDSLTAVLIIECRNNNSLFKSLRLESDDLKSYKKSVDEFKRLVAFVQKASHAPIDVEIPMRPRDSLFKTIMVLRDNGYNDEVLRWVLELVPTGKKGMPRLTEVINEEYAAFVRALEEHNQLGIINNLPTEE